MKILALTLALVVPTLLVAPASAQRPGSERYQQPSSRFPVLRKAFRQIRDDVRYHASTLRETASDLRHDVTSTIRGEDPARRSHAYGDRHETSYPPDQRDPAPIYDYERASRTQPIQPIQPIQPRREARRQAPVPPAPPIRSQAPPEPAAPRLDPEPSPKIVAPKPNRDRPLVQSPPPPKDATEPQPKPAPQPKSDPQPENGNPDSKKPIMGKIAYPEARRAGRPGFHYSPYEPYELLDTQDIEPGGLAKDPGNGKIFRIPK